MYSLALQCNQTFLAIFDDAFSVWIPRIAVVLDNISVPTVIRKTFDAILVH